MPNVQPYPWSALPSVDQAQNEREGQARRSLGACQAQRLVEVVSELLAMDLEAAEIQIGDQGAPPMVVSSPRVRLSFPGATVDVVVESQLAMFAIARLLEEPLGLVSAAPLPGPLLSAWHAVVLEVARRVVSGSPPTVVWEVAGAPSGVRCPFWLRVERASFRGELTIDGELASPPTKRESLPVTLPLVGAVCSLSAEGLGALGVGDVLLPGSGWRVDETGRGYALAVPATGTSGFELHRAEGLTYVGPRLITEMEEVVTSNDPASASPGDLVGDVPVLVRVEVASLTLTAREWATLAPGDVISAAQPVGGPVRLRVAGRVVALGELVRIGEELGVRITNVDPDPGVADP